MMLLSLVVVAIIFIVILCIWYLINSKPPFVCKPAAIPFETRDYIDYKDLLDARVRANPHRFNQHIYDNIISKSDDKIIQKGIIPIQGEKNAFLICKYDIVKEILTNDKLFSSNPFPDQRLIAPNAMKTERHKVIMKYLKKYYSQSAISKQIPIIDKIIKKIVENMIHRQRINNQIIKNKLGIDAMDGLCKLIVMKTALFMIGLPPKQYNSLKIVRNLIKFNDQMVKLIAPQGGIGYKISFSFTQLINVCFGLLIAFIPTIQLILKIGIVNAWNILRPDLNILTLPNIDRDNGKPRIQLWIYPNILYTVPKYFLYLNDLYEMYGIKAQFPNVTKETNIINGKNILQSLYDAECNGDMSRSEILVSIVQLMVNMTTANEIGNMIYRISNNNMELQKDLCNNNGQYDENVGMRLIEEVIRIDASLQRLPRRVTKNINDFYTQKFPKNSNLILMIGLANCDRDIFGNKSFEFMPKRYLNNNHDNNNNNNKKMSKPLTFGYGIHLCLGYLLVKREMNLTLKNLIECGIKKIIYKHGQRMVDIDVGNYGFKKLFIELK